MGKLYYTVKKGDWLSKIARRYGLSSWKVIHDHPDNEEFKKKRPDPNLIYPGDIIFIPQPEFLELEPKRIHSDGYKIKAEPPQYEEIDMIMHDHEGKAVADEPYTITIGGFKIEDKTEKDGRILLKFAPELLDFGYYVLDFQGRQYKLGIGDVDPVNEMPGLIHRLVSLGYAESAEDAESNLESCIKRFQDDHGIKVTGEADDATLDKLEKVYQGKEK